YTRTLGDQRLLCVVNLSDEPAACEVPEEFAAAQKLIEVGQPSISGGRAELAPWDAFVLAIL
ncbi:MAG: alpha-glucosidase C-terminal domain-containing protein, partial [Oscillospiraceae bacterium]